MVLNAGLDGKDSANRNLCHNLQAEVRHILLAERDGRVSGQVLGDHAGVHSTVQVPSLLWHFFAVEDQQFEADEMFSSLLHVEQI